MNELKSNIFISYCWSDMRIVDTIDKFCSFYNTILQRDIRDIDNWQSIKEFIKKIRLSDSCILVISENYLKSKNCMYEVMEVMKTEKYSNRIIPFVTENTNIYNDDGKLEYILYWKKEFERVEKKILEIDSRESTIEMQQNLKIIGEIKRNIGEFMNLISDMNNPQTIYGFCDALRQRLFGVKVIGSCMDILESIDPKLTFDNCISTESNRLTLAVCEMTVKTGFKYNPVYIYGYSEKHKTHILNALGNELRNKFPNKEILYTDFIELIRLIENHPDFELLYKEIETYDIILIKNISIVKTRSFEDKYKFSLILSRLIRNNKWVTLTATYPPREFDELFFKDIFNKSIITDLHPPDYESRIKIVEETVNYIGAENLIDDDAIMSIAKKVTSEHLLDNIDMILIRSILDNRKYRWQKDFKLGKSWDSTGKSFI